MGEFSGYKAWCFQILKEDEKEETEAETQNFVLLGRTRQRVRVLCVIRTRRRGVACDSKDSLETKCKEV